MRWPKQTLQYAPRGMRVVYRSSVGKAGGGRLGSTRRIGSGG
jgi:hypothetical protein